MGDGSEESKRKTSTGMENLSLETNRFSRDLLQRFMGSGSRQHEFKDVKREEEEEEEEEEEGDIELSLGLSLGGRFGVDKSSNKLMRSSSIASCLPVVRDDDALAPPPATVYPTLVRTSSLPVETEEEWRKRKELQTLRRKEAKRRRSEKQRNLRAERESGSGSGGGGGSAGGPVGEEEKRETEVNWRGRLELLAGKRFGSSASLPCGLSSLTTASRQASLGREIDLPIGKGKASYAGGSSGGLKQSLSQGSMESQGGSSSSVSEMKSRAHQGSSSGSDLSHASIQSLQERDAGSSGTKTSRTSVADKESPSKRTDLSVNRGKEIGMNAGEDMPCVFTKGDGPNGRRVDGILYKYGKGEEVRIMCVCHGSFLSPAEFVKHAGCSDVTHPLKHIVINPNPPSF